MKMISQGIIAAVALSLATPAFSQTTTDADPPFLWAGARPFPTDLQQIDPATLPPIGISYYSAQRWNTRPPVPANFLHRYEGLPGVSSVQYLMSPTFGANKVILADQNLDYDQLNQAMQELAALEAVLTPRALSRSTDEGAEALLMDYSTNYTDLWLSITNLGSFYGPSSCITTSTIVFHNTLPGRFYRLEATLSLDPALSAWSTACDGLLDDGGTIVTNVAWANAPTPAFWTNVVVVDGTNCYYYSNDVATIFFRGMIRPPGTSPATNGQLLVLVDGVATSFAPLVNGATYSDGPVWATTSQKLYALNPPLYSVNLGFGCDDYWPRYDFPSTPPGSPTTNAPQNAIAVFGLPGCQTLTSFTASRNPLTTLDVHGLTNQTDVEVYAASSLASVNLTNCPKLERITLEACSVQGILDCTGCTNLGDYRSALNQYTNAIVTGAESSIWHLCMRDNPQLDQTWATNHLASFTNLQELIMWNANQTGALNLASTKLTWVQVYSNNFTQINFTNCANLTNFIASNNCLSAESMEKIIKDVYTNSRYVNYFSLQNNGPTTPDGYAVFALLKAQIGEANCLIDKPPAWPVEIGGGWTLCQQTNIAPAPGSSSACQLAFPANNAVSNLLVCFSRDYQGDFTSSSPPTDSAGNNWSNLPSGSVTYYTGVGSGGHLRVWYCQNCKPWTNNNVTVPVNSGHYPSIWLCEFSGAATATVVDTNVWAADQSSSAGPTDNMACGPMTTQTNNLVVTFAAFYYGTGTAGTNSAPIDADNGGFGEYVRTAGAGILYPSMSTSHGSGDDYGMISVAFKHQ